MKETMNGNDVWNNLSNIAGDVYNLDNSYSVPALATVKKFLKRTKVDKRKYKADKYDCDDFAWHLRERANFRRTSRKYRWPFGYCHGYLNDPEQEEYHAFNIVLARDKGFKSWYCIEPQTDRISKFNKKTDIIDMVVL